MRINPAIVLVFALYAVVIACVGILGWRAERWFNWRFSYGYKVEQRIQSLEQRVERLEQQKGNTK